MRDHTYWPTFKALYSSDKITIQNVIGADFNRSPINEQSGFIQYSPEVSGRTDYYNNSTNRLNSLSYNGYWNFIINVKKKIMMVVGACLFLISAAQALPMFFGL
jgi:hypothetical protein